MKIQLLAALFVIGLVSSLAAPNTKDEPVDNDHPYCPGCRQMAIGIAALKYYDIEKTAMMKQVGEYCNNQTDCLQYLDRTGPQILELVEKKVIPLNKICNELKQC